MWFAIICCHGLVLKNMPAKAGDIRDASSSPGSGRSPGEGNDNPLQYSGLENFMDRGTWWATVHGQKESDTIEQACTFLGEDCFPLPHWHWLGQMTSTGQWDGSESGIYCLWVIACLQLLWFFFLYHKTSLSQRGMYPSLGFEMEENMWLTHRKCEMGAKNKPSCFKTQIWEGLLHSLTKQKLSDTKGKNGLPFLCFIGLVIRTVITVTKMIDFMLLKALLHSFLVFRALRPK